VLRTATFIAAFVAASAFTSLAEAHDRDDPYASPGGSPIFMAPLRHESHCERERRERTEAEFARMREEQIAQMQAQKAAAAAGAAKRRARLMAQQKQQASRVAAAKAAAARERAEAAERVAAAQKQAVAVAAKKEEIKPVAVPVVTKTAAVASSETCRKYSAAADGLIDAPCN
jgi:hypothetical protein